MGYHRIYPQSYRFLAGECVSFPPDAPPCCGSAATGSGSSGVRGHDFCEWKDREHG